MFDKLAVLVGTWNCADIPASKKPDVVTVKREGSYFVGRETGDSPSTSYTRWSHAFQRYLSNTINDNGAFSITQTASKDPNNGIWTYAYPSSLPKGKLYPYTMALAGSKMTVTGQYLDDKGKLQNAKSVCTKQ